MSNIYFNNQYNKTEIKLFNQDCLSGMIEHIKKNSVSVVVTSPPYNIGIKYNGYKDTMPKEKYLTWLNTIGHEIDRILDDTGSLFLNVGGTLIDPWIPMDIATSMRNIFTLQNVIHWVKSISIDKDDVINNKNIIDNTSIGHYKPISSKRFINDCHEYIFHFTKNGNTPIDRIAVGVPYQDKSNIKRWNNKSLDKRCRGNTWFIPYKTIQSSDKQRPHPASFPIKLPEMCIKLHGLHNVKLVIDPFVGIGNTAIACKKLGVSFIGFDIDKTYLEIAKQRIISY